MTIFLVDHVASRRTSIVARDYGVIRRGLSYDRDQWSRADRNRARRLKRKIVVNVLSWSKRPRFRVRSPWEDALRSLTAGHLMPMIAAQAWRAAP